MYLHIHFMNIFLSGYPEAGLCRHYDADSGLFCKVVSSLETNQLCDFHFSRISDSSIDSLSDRYFYLDPKNFHTVSEDDAESFLAGAWNLLTNYDECRDSYEILGLPENSDLKTVKARFRLLAKEHHPDLSTGHHEKFSQINSAYRSVVNYIQCRNSR